MSWQKFTAIFECKRRNNAPEWKRICKEYLQNIIFSTAGKNTGMVEMIPNRPETYLTYPDAEVVLPLGEPKFPQKIPTSGMSSKQTIENFTDTPMTLEELTILLWSSMGITAIWVIINYAQPFGALYPIETDWHSQCRRCSGRDLSSQCQRLVFEGNR